jgi:ABC-type Fe3+/spermidine/putrescine transport system ATPase subunit
VASFVGDTNRLRGELVSVAAAEAVIALGGVHISVPAELLSSARASGPIDLFVRPERLRIGAAGEAGSMAGQIVAQTYHGGHVDLQIACHACSDGLLLVRSSGDQAMIQLPPGTEVGISIDADGCAAFPLT